MYPLESGTCPQATGSHNAGIRQDVLDPVFAWMGVVGSIIRWLCVMPRAAALLLVPCLLTACGNSASHGSAASTPSPIAITASPVVEQENSTQIVTAQPSGSLEIVM